MAPAINRGAYQGTQDGEDQTFLYRDDTRRKVSLRERLREPAAGKDDLEDDPHTRWGSQGIPQSIEEASLLPERPRASPATQETR